MERIKLMVLDELKEERSEIYEMVSNVEYIVFSSEADSYENANEVLQEMHIDVLLIESKTGGDGYQIAEKLISDFPYLAVVIIESELKEDTMYKVLFAGAKDVIFRPFTASKLVDVIYRAYQLMQKKAVPQKEKPSYMKRKSDLGQVITVFSTKGGVGKTFISSSLAIALSNITKKRIVLVDLDLDFGNVALALNLIPRFTINDIVDDIRNIDADVIESYLIPHESGIRVLPTNARPQINEFVNAEHIEIILKALQRSFDYVIIDMPSRFYGPVNPAFIIADKLLMLTTPEISTIRNIKSSLSTLNDLNYPKSKIRMILNKLDSKGEIKAKDIENTLKMKIYSSIDADYRLVPSSLNQGVSILLKYPKSSVSKDIVKLANRIIEETNIVKSE